MILVKSEEVVNGEGNPGNFIDENKSYPSYTFLNSEKGVAAFAYVDENQLEYMLNTVT